MRIISGTSKGRRLAAPKGQSVRPTSDRVKESIFNILGREVEGTVVLDLFAGTGNLGMEALSRGAVRALFVEKKGEPIRLIRKNLLQCGMENRSQILQRDAVQAIGYLEEKGETFDLILIDPPYEKGLIQKTLMKLQYSKIYHRGSILVIQHDRRESLPEDMENWDLFRQRRIGDTLLSFLIPSCSVGEKK